MWSDRQNELTGFDLGPGVVTWGPGVVTWGQGVVTWGQGS